MTHQDTSRRTLLRGAAWTAPVIALAAASPAAAASNPDGTLTVLITFVSHNELSGVWVYDITVTPSIATTDFIDLDITMGSAVEFSALDEIPGFPYIQGMDELLASDQRYGFRSRTMDLPAGSPIGIRFSVESATGQPLAAQASSPGFTNGSTAIIIGN